MLVSSVHSFILRIYRHSECFCYHSCRNIFFFCLIMASFTCFDISLDFILIAPVKEPNTNSKPKINSRLFICFMLHSSFSLVMTSEWTTPGHQTVRQSIIKIWQFFEPLEKGRALHKISDKLCVPEKKTSISRMFIFCFSMCMKMFLTTLQKTLSKDFSTFSQAVV